MAGRLAYSIDTWKVLTGDPWVSEVIVGYQLPFKVVPYQVQRPPEAMFSKEQAALLREEVNSLLQKRTAERDCRRVLFSTVSCSQKVDR